MNYKKIIAGIMCLCMSLPAVSQVLKPVGGVFALDPDPNQDNNEYYPVQTGENFVYRNYGDRIEIVAIFTDIEGELVIPDSVDGVPVKVAGKNAFAGNQKITSIVLPDSITKIYEGAFLGDTALESVKLPSGITEIPDECFQNCMSLKEIDIPETVESIGLRAFCNCTALKSVKIPDSVTKFGGQIFDSCRNLTEVNIPGGISEIPEGFLYYSGVKEIVMPSNVTKICTNALPSELERLTVINSDCQIDDTNYMFGISKNKCVIVAPKGSRMLEFAESFGFDSELLPGTMCEPALKGDSNNDGDFGVADLVSLESYILKNQDITAPELADMNGDGSVDVFDLTLMRKSLMDSEDFTPAPMSINLSNTVTEGVVPTEIQGREPDSEFVLAQTDFSLNLLKQTADSSENVFISPYSAMQALAMTANGADGETKSQMEKVLGGLDVEKLNEYLYTQRISQPDEKYCSLKTYNSIWTLNDTERINVHDDFVRRNRAYYGADIFLADFDETTVKDINNWVKAKTDGMIPKTIEELSPETVMCLINTVLFDAKWQEQYYTSSVEEGDFTSSDGTVRKAEMMYSKEKYYLTGENAVGMYKLYEGEKYAFVGILPDEGISAEEYINSLTPESLNKMLSEKKTADAVYCTLPKFTVEYDNELSDELKAMGMTDAFEPYADFSNMADTDTEMLFINKVIHKTKIEMCESGTKAAAVTSVMMNAGASVAETVVHINLNRPFVYAIVDTETNIPVFMGTLNDIPE